MPCGSTATAATSSTCPAANGTKSIRDAPKGYDVFAMQGPSGAAYVLVHEDIAVSLS